MITIGLFPWIGWHSLWAIVGGYLIDADHVLWTGYKKGIYSIKKSYYHHLDRKKKKGYEKGVLHIFHTVEFVLWMVAMSYLMYVFQERWMFYMFAITLLGMIVHLTLDFTQLIHDKTLDARAISWYCWSQKKARKGL